MRTDYSKYVMTGRERLGLLVILICGMAAVGLLFYESLLTVLAVPFLWKGARRFREEQLRRKRQKKLKLQFRDFLNTVSSAFASGRHFHEALTGAEQEMASIYGSGELLPREIHGMLESMEVSGESDLTVLEDFAGRADLEDVSDFAQVFRACRESGGDLVSGIEKSARVLSEKITIENDIESMVSQKRFEGEIITAMPVVIVLALRILSPGYLDVMYTTLAGRILMTGCLGMIAAAYYFIERITDIAV